MARAAWERIAAFPGRGAAWAAWQAVLAHVVERSTAGSSTSALCRAPATCRTASSTEPPKGPCALAVDFPAYGITVNAIAPGAIHVERDDREGTSLDGVAARIPAGRWGTPDDIGTAVRYLASDEAGYVNGAVLLVDGSPRTEVSDGWAWLGRYLQAERRETGRGGQPQVRRWQAVWVARSMCDPPLGRLDCKPLARR